MVDLSPLQTLLLAIVMPPFLVILAALGWQCRPGPSPESDAEKRQQP